MPEAVEVVGLADLAREAKRLGPEWPKRMTRVHRTVATPLAAKARANATAMGGVQAHNARTIKGKATPTSAGVGPTSIARNPSANVAYWGRKGRSGWYANPDHAGSGRPQGPAWVGSSWQAGERGQGPYALNDAVADMAGTYEAQMHAQLSELVARMFPD